MNAQTRPAAATPTTPIVSLLAFENAALITRLATSHLPLTQVELAREFERDPSNLRKTLGRMVDEQLVILDDDKRPLLTERGRDAFDALQRMNGVAAPAQAVTPSGFMLLSAEEIDLDPGNARKVSGLTPLEIEEMAASIREHGLLTPPTVRAILNPFSEAEEWILVAGQRRLLGWRLAIERGWLPADTRYLCKLFAGDDIAATEAQLIENLQRVDLDNLEAAEGLLALSDKETPPASAASIAKRLGKDNRWVEERLKVAREAKPATKADYRAGTITWTQLRDSVKQARHLAALEKEPRLALLVAELAALSDQEGGCWDDPVEVAFVTPGGLIERAAEVGLLTLNRAVPAAALTQAATDWLAAEGFGDDEETVLAAIRARALGPMGAAALPPGKWATDALNVARAPTPDPTSSPSPSSPSAPSPAGGLVGDDFSRQIRAITAGEAGADDAPSAPAAQPEPQPEVQPEPRPDLPAVTTRQAACLAVLAQEMQLNGEETRGGAIRGVRVYNFSMDADWSALQMARPALVQVVQNARGDGWLGVLTPAALAWLNATWPDGVANRHIQETADLAGVAVADLLRCLDAPEPRSEAAPAPVQDPPPKGEGDRAAPGGVVEGASPPPVQTSAQPHGDIIITGLRAAAADLWHAARDARRILDNLIEGHGAGDDEMAAAAARVQDASMALAPYLSAEQKADR